MCTITVLLLAFVSIKVTYQYYRCRHTQKNFLSSENNFATIHIQLSKVQTFEHVTIMPLLNRRCRTASQWCISVFTISPEPTSHTRTVESLDPLMITLSSYWRHSTEPVWPVNTYKKKAYYKYVIWKCIPQRKSYGHILWNSSPEDILTEFQDFLKSLQGQNTEIGNESPTISLPTRHSW